MTDSQKQQRLDDRANWNDEVISLKPPEIYVASNAVARFTTWLFWTVTYWFRRRPNELSEGLLYGRRTRWPWKKFRPHAWHNDVGSQWEVYFTDERACTERRTIELEVHVGEESGDIVGFDVYDKTLLRKDMDE